MAASIITHHAEFLLLRWSMPTIMLKQFSPTPTTHLICSMDTICHFCCIQPTRQPTCLFCTKPRITTMWLQGTTAAWRV